MKGAADDLHHLDVARLAETGAERAGTLPGALLARLAEDALSAPADVHWSARGERRRAVSAAPETWLHLQCHGAVELTCQRCLQAVTQDLDVERAIRFVADEADAERLDEDADDDVLALPPGGLDLAALIEDELILALPIVPRHASCPEPLPLSSEPVDEAAPNPFAALASLKGRLSSGGE